MSINPIPVAASVDVGAALSAYPFAEFFRLYGRVLRRADLRAMERCQFEDTLRKRRRKRAA